FTMQAGVATSWVKANQKENAGWFYMHDSFGDFILRTEYRIVTPGANSGVFVRAPLPSEQQRRLRDFDTYQIDVSEEPNPLEMTGAICFIKAPTTVPQKPREWNELEINVIGQHYLIKVNGVLVNDFTGNKALRGYIGMQNVKLGGMQYRNMRVKELSSAEAATIEHPPVVSSEERWKNAINLLALVDVAADTSGGIFIQTPSGLVTNKNTLCKLDLPYYPPAEYDFRMSFTCLDGVGEFAQMLSKSNRSFEWMMGANGSFFGFQMIGGADASRNATTRQFRLDRSRKYTSLVEVREDGLKSYLDDKLISSWKTNYSDMTPKDHWVLRTGTRLGVGTLGTAAVIHSAEVIEVTGKGNLVRTARTGSNVTASATLAGKTDAEGFVSLFNGRDLTGWDGDTNYWSVRNGVILAESPTSGARVPTNTCLIWKDGKPADFELRMSYKISAGNSGVQYRSRVVDPAQWRVGGYQYEMEATKRDTNGALYEELGIRGPNSSGPYLVNAGESVRAAATGERIMEKKLGTPYTYHAGTWNDLVIVARGNHLTQTLNGKVTVELTDEDPKARADSGVIALQLHAGTPQKVEFKDIRLKEFPAGAAR
ncbi:MAG TPA: DUF1080 domain-containing protein, partial [Chthoniobacter sp.]|nr:DUF1080 domain-containing protein [Chthoniobacter sp.]